LRISAIGDATHVLPVDDAIRQHAHADITWIISKLEARLLTDLPGVELYVCKIASYWRTFFFVFSMSAFGRLLLYAMTGVVVPVYASKQLFARHDFQSDNGLESAISRP
jgi:hypothetical protein